jgi:protein-arginine kinase activator protein McsA
MKDKHPVVEPYRGLCEGFKCSKQPSTFIHVRINQNSSIVLHLCKQCATIFKDADQSKKEASEQAQVARPACSNTLSHHKSIGLLLND